LLIDSYLDLDRLKIEADKALKAAGNDMGTNVIMKTGTFVVNSACKAGTAVHATLGKAEAVHRNELRMLKRLDAAREKAKEEQGIFRIIPGGRWLSQLTSNTWQLTRNAVDGTIGGGVDPADVTKMENAYRRVGEHR
jgi:hypothetical protein